MATVMAMDIDECEASGKAKVTAALSINKSSGAKISKPASSSMRRPGGMVQPSKPPPTSKVYNTDPMSFRELVQQLTGNSSTTTSSTTTTATTSTSGGVGGGDASGGVSGGGVSGYSGYSGATSMSGGSLQQHQGYLDHPGMVAGFPSSSSQQRQQQRHHQVVTDPALLITTGLGSGGGGGGSGVLSPHSSARPVNSRLQRMAPPPLRPTFPAFKLPNQQQQQQQQYHQVGGPGGGGQQSHAAAGASATSGMPHAVPSDNTAANLTSPGAQPLSPLSNKRVSPVMPLLSFSPLPVLSPSDTAWANFESPNTAAMKQLAQSIIDGGGRSCGAFAGGRFPWSPTFQGCLGLPSPGLPVPELFPEVTMIDSPEDDMKKSNKIGSGMTAAASSGSSDFSFPEIRES